jgi:quercetin dioxygenase-like cupin family protein
LNAIKSVYRHRQTADDTVMRPIDLTVDGFLGGLLGRLQGVHGLAQDTADEIAALSEAWPRGETRGAVVEPERLPACDWLSPALDLGRSGSEAGLAISIAALAPALHWTYSYPDRSLAGQIAFSQIVGRRGLRRGESLHIGLTLIAPHVAYPPHAHPAVELYLVIAGTARWQRGLEPPAPQPPGSIVLHASNVPHAMTTGDEPLLAIWTWRGDLDSPSRYLDAMPVSPFLHI